MKLTVDKFKRSAKRLADQTSKPLNEAQEILAHCLGLGNFNAALKSLETMAAANDASDQPAGKAPHLPQSHDGPITPQLCLRLFAVAADRFSKANPRVNLLLPAAVERLSSYIEKNPEERLVKTIQLADSMNLAIDRFMEIAKRLLTWNGLLSTFMHLRDEEAETGEFSALKRFVFDANGLSADPLLHQKFVDPWLDASQEAERTGFGGPVNKPQPIDFFIPTEAQAEHRRMLAILLNALGPCMKQLAKEVAMRPRPFSPRENLIRLLAYADKNEIMAEVAKFLPAGDGEAKILQEKPLVLMRAVLDALCEIRDTQDFDLRPETLAQFLSPKRLLVLHWYSQRNIFTSGMPRYTRPWFGEIARYIESLPRFHASCLMSKAKEESELIFGSPDGSELIVENPKPIGDSKSALAAFYEAHESRMRAWVPLMEFLGVEMDYSRPKTMASV